MSSSVPRGDLTYSLTHDAGQGSPAPTYRLMVATIERDGRVAGTLLVGGPGAPYTP